MAATPRGRVGASDRDPIEGIAFSSEERNELPDNASEFERCRFAGLDLKGLRFAGRTFVDSTFQQCDLSLVELNGTSFRNVRFVDCKLVGARFDHCHAFLLSFRFERCNLELASFHGLRVKGTHFMQCRLREADLSSADLSHASFGECDLGGAIFEDTTLEGADLRTAVNYSIDPGTNRLRKARFSRDGLSGLLDRTGIIVSD